MSESAAIIRATALLENLRRSPMTRGNKLTEPRRMLREAIASAIQREGVPERLAARISRQLVVKFEPRDLGSVSTWRAVGQLLRAESDRLQNKLQHNPQIFVLHKRLGVLTGVPPGLAVELLQFSRDVEFKVRRCHRLRVRSAVFV